MNALVAPRRHAGLLCLIAAVAGGLGDPEAVRAQATPDLDRPRITTTWDAAPIADVAAAFAALSGKTIVLGADVQGLVTAEIAEQPWDLAFDAILEAQGLSAVEVVPGIIRVYSRAGLVASDSLEPLVTTLIRLNWARAPSLVPALQSVLSARGRIAADSATNALIVTDVASRTRVICELLRGPKREASCGSR